MGLLVVISFKPDLRSFIDITQSRFNFDRSQEYGFVKAPEKLQSTHNDEIGVRDYPNRQHLSSSISSLG